MVRTGRECGRARISAFRADHILDVVSRSEVLPLLTEPQRHLHVRKVLAVRIFFESLCDALRDDVLPQRNLIITNSRGHLVQMGKHIADGIVSADGGTQELPQTEFRQVVGEVAPVVPHNVQALHLSLGLRRVEKIDEPERRVFLLAEKQHSRVDRIHFNLQGAVPLVDFFLEVEAQHLHFLEVIETGVDEDGVSITVDHSRIEGAFSQVDGFLKGLSALQSDDLS
mmetsp:Transcript_16322/g.42052  ORF Transcript_16322/g.42052 Transcript_16322/m.42052 type:complete len:226 (+) Transcript_16322:823-1500(+)